MAKQEQRKDPLYRCDSCKKQPRLYHSGKAYTPLYHGASYRRDGEKETYAALARVGWLAGNGMSPGDCLDMVKGEGCPLGEDKVYRLHKDVRVAMAFLEQQVSSEVEYRGEIV